MTTEADYLGAIIGLLVQYQVLAEDNGPIELNGDSATQDAIDILAEHGLVEYRPQPPLPSGWFRIENFSHPRAGWYLTDDFWDRLAQMRAKQ